MLHKIYSILPHSLKKFALSVYANKLQSFRFGEDSKQLISEAEAREKWTKEEWTNYQQQELEKVLAFAVSHVPYYKQYWEKRGYPNHEWKQLENWPILTKEELRKNNHLFLADTCNPKKMYTEYTSGTTGTPITVWWSKETTRKYYAIYERRIKNVHGVNRHQPYLMLGGRLVVPVGKTKPPFWIHNKKMNQLYLSSYHLSEKNAEAYAKTIHQFAPVYMMGYASSMYSLAKLAEQQQIEMPKLTCAISNAEPLLLHQRELIEKVFHTTMVNTYGMSELVAGACSMQGEDLVLWPEIGYTEVLHINQDAPVEMGESGRLVFTSLLNKEMPLIRYDSGDLGSLAPCERGIQFYKITELTGRMDDMIILKDGRLIGRLDPIFKNSFNIKEAQIIQHTLDSFIVQVVPDNNYSTLDGVRIEESLKKRIGECTVTIKLVDAIPRTSTGKFKAVVSEISLKDATLPPESQP